MLLNLPGTNDPGLSSQPLSLHNCGSGMSLPHPVVHPLSVLSENAIADMYSFDCFSTEGGRGGHRLRAEFVHILGARLLAFL